MAYKTKTIKLAVCDNCKREEPGTLPYGWMEWWEKDGLNKTLSRAEGKRKGWAHHLNCPACIRMGDEMAMSGVL